MPLTLVHIRERRRGGRCRGNMEELVGGRKGMLTTREWCNPVSNMLHHV